MGALLPPPSSSTSRTGKYINRFLYLFFFLYLFLPTSIFPIRQVRKLVLTESSDVSWISFFADLRLCADVSLDEETRLYIWRPQAPRSRTTDPNWLSHGNDRKTLFQKCVSARRRWGQRISFMVLHCPYPSNPFFLAF